MLNRKYARTLSQLLVSLTSDTEDNHPAYVPGWHDFGSDYNTKPGVVKWDWTRYWPDLSSTFRSQDVPVTWLVHVDDGPMRDSMLDLFRYEMLELKSNGDEVGVHIHTFTWDLELSQWIQTKDPKLESTIVRRSIDMFKRKLGYTPLSVRMGWHRMSNEIMEILDASGLLVDASAIPGSSCSGKFGKRDNVYDWSKAPHVPYHPSYGDYQSPGDMKILEMPISTANASKSNLFGALVNKLSGIGGLVRVLPLARSLRLNPNPYFYVSPWWSLSVISQIIKAYHKKCIRDGTAFLVGSFHACDILDPRTGEKNLVFERYLSRIIKEISSLRGIEVTFTTLSEMARNYDMGRCTHT